MIVFSPPLSCAVDVGAMTLDIHFWAGPGGFPVEKPKVKDR